MNILALLIAAIYGQCKYYQTPLSCANAEQMYGQFAQYCVEGCYMHPFGTSHAYDGPAYRDLVDGGTVSSTAGFPGSNYQAVINQLCRDKGLLLGGVQSRYLVVRDLVFNSGTIWEGNMDIYDIEYLCIKLDPAELCHNGKDDNQNGWIDCEEETCRKRPDCLPDPCIGCCGSGKSSVGSGTSNKFEKLWKSSNASCPMQCSKEPKDPCEPVDGEPVEVNTGRQTDAREDLAIPGRVPVSVAPFFRSTSSFLGVHGQGFSSFLTTRLISWEDSTWSIRDERGDREDFDRVGKNVGRHIAVADLTLTTDSVLWEPEAGKRYTFSRKNGTLVSLRDPRGGGVAFVYEDSAGAPYQLPIKGISYTASPAKIRGVIGMDHRVKAITSLDNPAHIITLTYDTAGLLASAKDPSGREVRYTYDLAGNQTRITYPDGTLRRYFYQDTAKFHRLTAFDASPIRPSMAADTTILTKNLFDGKERVASQSYQGSSYEFDRADWRDSTYHDLIGLTFLNAARRVTAYFRKTTVNQAIPDGRGGVTSRKTIYDDFIENCAQQDSLTGDLLEPIHWLSRSLTETNIVGTDTLTRVVGYDQSNNIIRRIEPDGTVIVFSRDALARVAVQTETPAVGRGTARVIRNTYDGTSDRVLREVVSSAGDSTVKEWTYDAQGRVLTESVWRDAAAKTVTTKTWDALGRLLTETSPTGAVTTNVYLASTAFQPDSVRFADGTGERLIRDVLGRVLQKRNHLGQSSWTTYDALGRELVACQADSACVRRTYNGPDLVLLEEGVRAQSNGTFGTALRTTRYEVDGWGRRVKEARKAGSRWVLKRKSVLDAMGNELEAWDNPDSTNTDSTRWRLVERNRYDGRNQQLERRTFPNGTTADSLVVKYKRDANGRVASEMDPRGAMVRRVNDPWGNVVSDTDAVGRVTRRTYDHRSLLVQETDPVGNTTRYEYDALGNLVRQIGWHADTVLRLYDRGRLAKERSAEGNWTVYRYDTLSRLVRLISKVGDTALAADSNDVFTDYGYDLVGRRIREAKMGIPQSRLLLDQVGRVLRDTNVLGVQNVYVYDVLGRQTRILTPAGDYTYISYDNQGRPWIRRIGTDTLSITRYDDADRPVWVRTPGQGVAIRVFDKTDYVTQSSDSTGIVSVMVQDRMGRDSLVSVAGKTSRRTVRDGAGRTVEQWDERGYRISMGYDVLDRLVSLKDNENNITGFAYVDSAGGWRRTTTFPDLKKEHHVYDREGRLRRFVDGRGIRTEYAYDSLSRLKKIDYFTATGASAATGIVLSYNRLSQLTKASQGTALVDSMTYDNLGRIATNRQTVSGTTYAMSYGYDMTKRIRLVNLPGGISFKQRWTVRGLLDSLWMGAKLISKFGYASGLETSRNLSNGIVATQSYDPGGRVKTLKYTLSGQTLPDLGIGYDPSGNRNLIRKNHATTASEAMAYTPDNQLSTWKRGTADAAGAIASPTSNQGWALDSRGNWTQWTTGATPESRTHTGANELTQKGAVAITWDAAGNLLNDGQRTWVWGARGLLDTVKQGTTVKGLYTYDPLGRRAMKQVGSIKTISLYDGWQCVYQKVTGSGTDTTKTFVYGNYIDEPIAMVRSWGTTSDTVWYLQGNNYNVEALTNRTGAIVERYAYTPYGEPTVYTAAGTDGKWFTADDVTASVSAKGNALTFQGRELDAETGVYYFRNRYYSAQMGRFVSRDPIRMRILETPIFKFELNNSISNLDPKGLLELQGECNCLGYASSGDKFITRQPDKRQSLHGFLKELGWTCRKVTNSSDCKCACNESKMLVFVYKNIHPGNAGIDVFDGLMDWEPVYDSAQKKYFTLSDFHAMRSVGCSGKWKQIPEHYYFYDECVKFPEKANPLKFDYAPKTCCCKDEAGK